MKLHKEGYQTLINELIIILVLAYFTFSNSSVILEVFLLFMLFIFIITLNFFRIPKRSFERKEGVIYAPCDGKVVVIEETKEIAKVESRPKFEGRQMVMIIQPI